MLARNYGGCIVHHCTSCEAEWGEI